MQERQEPTLDNPAASATTAAATAAAVPAAAPPLRKKSWVRRGLLALLVLGLTSLGLGAGLWWWTGQAGSLARTLALAQRWLPAEQTLQFTGVEGSLRYGGQIADLRWTDGRIQLHIQELDAAWDMGQLWQRHWAVERLALQAVHIRSTPSPQDSPPAAPLQALVLPLEISLPVHIQQLTWGDGAHEQLTQLQADYTYRFATQAHQLQLPSLHYAQDQHQYHSQGQFTLQGPAPMQLQGQLHTQVTLPPELAPSLAGLAVQATVSGPLAGPQARLQLQAQAQAESTDNVANSPTLLALQAHITPWQAQPLPQAQADIHALNLAWLLPQLPTTALSGQIAAHTDVQGVWHLQAQLDNPQAGAWDQQLLPVQQLSAQARWAEQTLHLEQLTVHLPGGAQGGQLQAQGQWQAATQAVQAQLQLQQLNPARLWSSLPPQAVSGSAEVHSDADQALQWQLDIHDRATRNGLHTAQAQGRWLAPQLEINALHISGLGAEIHSPALAWNQDSQTLQAQLQAQLPGAEAQFSGTASPSTGQGQLHAQVDNLEVLTHWLGTLPGLHTAALPLQGQARLQAQWQGGWNAVLAADNTATPTPDSSGSPASPLQLNAALDIPQLRYAPPQSSVQQLQEVQLQMQGSLDKFTASLRGQMQQDAHRLAWDVAAQGRWSPQHWQAQLSQLQLRARPAHQPADWLLALDAPVQLTQRAAALHISAGALGITPPAVSSQAAAPAAKSAHLRWQDSQIHLNTGALHTQGVLEHLPLSWVDIFSPDPDDPLLARAGISGDLVLQGQWDVDTIARQPRIHAVLERSAGDVRLAADDGEGAAAISVIRSSGSTGNEQRLRQPHRGQRIRLQHLQLQLGLEEGRQLHASVLWASERAGTIHADIRSPLQRNGKHWAWPEDAPISGSVQALLPNIGVWAMRAPPGWRVSGSFGGDVLLGGTRTAPTWQGEIRGDALAVSSLLEGVNLKNGAVRARFAGNRLDIDRLYLEGGHASATRVPGMGGNLTAPPTEGGSVSGSGFIVYDPAAGGHGLQMDVQAQAHNLQVLGRGDRQLGISGQVNARMHDAQLHLRGDLAINRAALILADAAAPSLDSDVHVQSAALRELAAQAQAQAARKAARQPPEAGTVRAALRPDIQITLDLGPDFALQGYGLTTRLQGQLNIHSGPRITGEIHTAQGRYRAWGQSLDIEQGVIRFNGAYDNPSLDIIALRPNIPVRAGVKVAGSANNPRVVLYSDPVLPDGEKLSWVVMGRDPASGGAETALLQQAALALLSGGSDAGGNFASQVGLDEIGIKGPGNGAEGAALTVGKRISQDLYLAYEQSLNGAMGTLFIFYDLTKRLTLRGQTGEQTAMDLIYTQRKD